MFPLSTPLPLKNYLHYPKKEMSMGLSIHTFAAERKNPYNEAAKEVLRYEKAIQFMLLAALVVSVSGCANTNHPQAIRESSDIEALRSEIDENAVPKETLTDSFRKVKRVPTIALLMLRRKRNRHRQKRRSLPQNKALRWGYNRRRQSFQTIRRNPNRRKPLSLPLNQSQRQRSSQHSNRQKKNQRRNLH